MKKLIFITLLMFLFSCEKENIHCWKCETMASGEIISTVTTCGMTEENIGDFKAGLEVQASVIYGEVKTDCKISNYGNSI
jgi:hypothetical protein